MINFENLGDENYKKMANAIRILSAEAVELAKSGHPGMPLGFADVATILFSEFLRFNPRDPHWINRDRFILSAGHGSMLLYSLLYLTGYDDINLEDIKNFRKLHSKTAGHPEYGFLKGIETTTGPLGQGLANAVGMAIGSNILKKKFGDEIINHKIYTIVGDGCLMEGISHEAASLAGHLKLKNLVVLFDDNHISIDGPTSLTISEDITMRFNSYGWNVISANGHNFGEIREALKTVQNSDKPSLIAFRTNIGQGSPNKVGKETSHGAPLGENEVKLVKEKLGWEDKEFYIPVYIKNLWEIIGKNSTIIYDNWQKRLNLLNEEEKKELNNFAFKKMEVNFQNILSNIIDEYISTQPIQATRKSSGQIISKLINIIPNLIGGSADLSGSNETKSNNMELFTKEKPGNYIHYGVREHAMGGIMNGLALYGYIPYGGTFLVFTDYMRPSIRLASIMNLQVIYIMTHDSIGLGEDGPTHQPIEHLSSLRAMPNLLVLRPADAIETVKCWEIALENNKGPTLLALSRQNLPIIFKSSENDCRKGAYFVKKSSNKIDALLFASGSEVHIAINASILLEAEGIYVNVVSVPSIELFFKQNEEYIKSIIDDKKLKLAIEAGIRQSWDRIIGSDGIFIGMETFGASAPYEELYKYFKITAEEIVNRVKHNLRMRNENRN